MFREPFPDLLQPFLVALLGISAAHPDTDHRDGLEFLDLDILIGLEVFTLVLAPNKEIHSVRCRAGLDGHGHGHIVALNVIEQLAEGLIAALEWVALALGGKDLTGGNLLDLDFAHRGLWINRFICHGMFSHEQA